MMWSEMQFRNAIVVWTVKRQGWDRGGVEYLEEGVKLKLKQQVGAYSKSPHDVQ